MNPTSTALVERLAAYAIDALARWLTSRRGASVATIYAGGKGRVVIHDRTGLLLSPEPKPTHVDPGEPLL